VPETNESDNCGSWTLLVVCDADQIWDGSQCVGAPVQANLYAVSPIVIGDSSYLTWTSTNATHCTSSDFSTGASHPPQSSDPGVKVTPSASRDYTIQCTNDSGQSGTSSAHVEVKNPEVFINANPPLVRIGTPSTISWGTTLGHVTSCSVTGPGLNSTAISNAGTPVVINAESTFVINCHAGAFYPSDSATVKVAPSFIEF
jgi:hypothetical protein